MSYARWGFGSNWYIYWNVYVKGCGHKEASKKEQETLTCIHDKKSKPVDLTYSEVKEFLLNSKWEMFGSISKEDKRHCLNCMTSFIIEMDRNWAEKKNVCSDNS